MSCDVHEIDRLVEAALQRLVEEGGREGLCSTCFLSRMAVVSLLTVCVENLQEDGTTELNEAFASVGRYLGTITSDVYAGVVVDISVTEDPSAPEGVRLS